MTDAYGSLHFSAIFSASLLFTLVQGRAINFARGLLLEGCV